MKSILFFIGIFLILTIINVDARGSLDYSSDILLNQKMHIDYECPQWATLCKLEIILPDGKTETLVESIPPGGGGIYDYLPLQPGDFTLILRNEWGVIEQNVFTVSQISIQDIIDLKKEVNNLKREDSLIWNKIKQIWNCVFKKECLFNK